MIARQKILFIAANRIGDAVLSTGVLHQLVKDNPDAKLTIVCGPVAKDIFRAVPNLERLIVLQKKKRHGHWFDFWKTCFPTQWDLIVDLRNSFASRLLRAKERAYRPAHMTNQHKVIDNARALNLNPPPSPFLWLDEKAIDNAAKLLCQNSAPVIALGPAANWPAKQWSTYKFGLLIKDLIEKNSAFKEAKILLLAAPNEKEQVSFLLDMIPRDRIIDAIGQDLLTVAACLKQCRLFIGNDSGLMHISAAVGTPTLGLFGPGYENVYGPWGENTATIRTPETTAQLLKLCPYPGAFHPNLMNTLTVETVLGAAENLLKRTA